MTVTQSDPEEAEPTDQPADGVVLRMKPTTKPTLIQLGIVLLGSIGVFAYLQVNPEAIGSPDLTTTASLLVLLLGAILTLRYLVRTIILVRTTYTVTTDRIEQQYELLFRTHAKGIRFEKVRSHEMNQNRIQSLLGYGSISVNRGLGPLNIEDVENPDDVYETVRSLAN
jgi:hypothetical protein